MACADLDGGWEVLTPLENHKAIGFLSNLGPGPMENHEAVGFLSNLGPGPMKKLSSQHSMLGHLNGISLAGQ